MERPTKRLKITNPDVRNPRDTGSRMTEGLFTSELGMQGDDTDHKVQPTRTISLSDFQRQNVFGSYQHAPRPVLPRRNAGIYLFPRAPDATVTASVVQVNVNDGTSTSKITEVTVATTGTVVSLSEVGTLTTAVSLTIPGLSNSTSTKGSSTDSSQQTITTPPLTSTTSSSTSILSSSNGSDSINGTITSSDTSTGERTVTVTATSTFELSVINGTIITTVTDFDTSPTSGTDLGITGTSSSSITKTYYFGDLTSTLTSSSDSLTSSDSFGSGAFSTYFPNGSGAGAAGSPTATTDSAATSSAGSGSKNGGGGGGPGLTPTQQQVVGGVVGGVAGIALTLVIILFVLRWYRRRLKARGQLPEQIAARELAGGGGGGGGEAYPMSQRSSTTPLTVAVAHGLKRLRPRSSQTLGTTATGTTDSSVPESERGFQRIAGRKIAPVLSSGGDPYGGNFGAFEKDAGVGPSDMPRIPERGLSGASFYQDKQGFYGGKGTPTPSQVPSSPTTAATPVKTGDSSTPVGTASSAARDFAELPRAPSILNSSQLSLSTPSRPEGFAIMRPSPARTPVTLSPAASSIRLPIQQPPSMDEDAPPLPPMLRDGVGRSLASQDGSRVSRSSGRSAGRFTENM